MRTESLNLAKSVYRLEAECLLKALDYFDDAAFEKAVEALKNAPRIATTGCGHSGIICRHFAHLLCCIERPARFLSPAEAVHGGTGYLQKGDVMVLASRGGKTDELIPILEICKKKGVICIAVTENLQSPLATGSDIVLKQFVTREADPENTQGTVSSVALCAVFHSLQTALLMETDFKSEQFALIHPGGAVGARLNENK